ncbi:MAG: hypothetical protein GX116_01060, partial [Fibrobacter sp.]|nr:hypothetical protein [Fibrobacter sp.]
MSINTKVLNLLNLLSNDLFEREYLLHLTFLALFIKQPVFLFGLSGSGKNFIARRAIQMFQNPKVLSFIKRYKQIPDNLNEYHFAFFQGFDSKNPLSHNFVNIILQEKESRSILITSKERPESALNRAGIADQIFLSLSLPEVYSPQTIEKLLTSTLSVHDIQIPEEIQISFEEQEKWLIEIKKVKLSTETLHVISQVVSVCNKNHVYVSIQKWMSFALMVKSIAFFNQRSETTLTDTFFLGTSIWNRRIQSDILTEAYQNILSMWLKEKIPFLMSFEKQLENLKIEVEKAVNASNDVYETTLINGVECVAYSITIAGEHIPLYAPVSYIGTHQKFNPFNELRKKETRVLCNFMGSSTCEVSVDSTARKTGLRATTNTIAGKSFEAYAKLPARVLSLNDETKAQENKNNLQSLALELDSMAKDCVSAMALLKQEFQGIKKHEDDLFLNKEVFNSLIQEINSYYVKSTECGQELKRIEKSLKTRLMDK